MIQNGKKWQICYFSYAMWFVLGAIFLIGNQATFGSQDESSVYDCSSRGIHKEIRKMRSDLEGLYEKISQLEVAKEDYYQECSRRRAEVQIRLWRERADRIKKYLKELTQERKRAENKEMIGLVDGLSEEAEMKAAKIRQTIMCLDEKKFELMEVKEKCVNDYIVNRVARLQQCDNENMNAASLLANQRKELTRISQEVDIARAGLLGTLASWWNKTKAQEKQDELVKAENDLNAARIRMRDLETDKSKIEKRRNQIETHTDQDSVLHKEKLAWLKQEEVEISKTIADCNRDLVLKAKEAKELRKELAKLVVLYIGSDCDDNLGEDEIDDENEDVD